MTALDPISLTVELPIVLRMADQEDIPRMEWYGQYAHFRNLFRRSYREQVQGKRIMLVADCRGFPVGYLFIQFKSTSAHIADGKNRAYFYSFRVMDLFQGKRIGTTLIREAETIIKNRGFRYGTIAVAKDNPRALHLYQRLGYRKFAEDGGRWSYTDHRGQIRHVEEPCWVLEKNLMLR